MRIECDSEKGCHYQVRDCRGLVIPYVVSYDSETKEIEMNVMGYAFDGKSRLIRSSEGERTDVITVKAFLPGSYLVDLRTGKRVECTTQK